MGKSSGAFEMKKTRKQKLKFKEAPISLEAYKQLTGPEFEDFSEQVRAQNRLWVRNHMRNPNIQWILVSQAQVIDSGDSNLVPSFFQVQEKTKGQLAYLIFRPGQKYCDLELFLP